MTRYTRGRIGLPSHLGYIVEWFCFCWLQTIFCLRHPLNHRHTHTDKHTGWQACFLAGTSLIRLVVVWENNFNLAKLNAACDRQNVERVRRKTTEDGDGDGDGA